MTRTIVLAPAISAVVATLGRRTMRERLSHACWLFVSCVASVIAGSWIMYLIHG
jgi:hypothetical protein